MGHGLTIELLQLVWSGIAAHVRCIMGASSHDMHQGPPVTK